MKNKVYRLLPLVVIGVVVLNFFIVQHVVKEQNKRIFDFYSGVVEEVQKIDPEATPKVISQIKQIRPSEKGAEILESYGYTSQNLLAANSRNQIQNEMFLYLSISTGILLFAFVVLIYLDKKRVKEDSLLIGEYIDDMLAGNYQLDIRDNKEGDLSLLKNHIYKVTVKLKEQSEQLEREKLALKDTLANISHQIKTPLTSLLVMNELLGEDIPAKQRKEFVENSTQQLERIKWLMETLLKLAKFDANTIELKSEVISIEKLVEASVKPLLVPMDIKEQTLHIKGDPKAEIIGDFNWTQEALSNILKNCMEHTPQKGKIEIDYTDNPLFVQIQVKDNGKGISPKELPNIFRRFYRGQSADSNSVGIGLALAQTVMGHQNGEIKASSVLGKGTTFTIKVYKRAVTGNDKK